MDEEVEKAVASFERQLTARTLKEIKDFREGRNQSV